MCNDALMELVKRNCTLEVLYLYGSKFDSDTLCRVAHELTENQTLRALDIDCPTLAVVDACADALRRNGGLKRASLGLRARVCERYAQPGS